MTALIAIEGIDGSGKGTQTHLLVRRLTDVGCRAAAIPFPRYESTRFGAAIGEYLNGRFGRLESVHPQLAAVLYAGDRFESLGVLQNAVDENDVVILDRFTGSNLAHQAARLDGDERKQLIGWIDDIEHRVFGLPRPDLNVLLDVSCEWSRELVRRKDPRAYTTQEADLHERDLPYLDRVRQCYREIAASQSQWAVIDCLDANGQMRAVRQISDDILSAVRPLLPNHFFQTNSSS